MSVRAVLLLVVSPFVFGNMKAETALTGRILVLLPFFSLYIFSLCRTENYSDLCHCSMSSVKLLSKHAHTQTQIFTGKCGKFIEFKFATTEFFLASIGLADYSACECTCVCVRACVRARAYDIRKSFN